jgi:restriction system protein
MTMRFKMSENSLFAYLLRSPSWISFSIAIVLGLVARFILPDLYAPYAWSFTLPFVVTGVMVAWKQRHAPSAARVTATLEAIAAMSWRDFSALMVQALERDGYVVTRTEGAADFVLVKGGRTSLLSCKRWKAASHGIEPLRELDAARRAQELHAAIYVVTGNITDNAQRFAADHRVTLMQAPELTQLLRLSKGSKSKR